MHDLLRFARVRHCVADRSSPSLLGMRAGRPMPPAPTCPGKQPLQQILDSIQGPVAKIIAVIIIIITGLTLAFGETSGGFRRLIQIVFGLSIAFAASSFFLSFFPLRRRSAGLMSEISEPIAGLRCAGPPRADRADPARRRAARGRDRQRHARRGASASACASGSPALALWVIGHLAAVWAAKRDPHFVDVVRRHLRYPAHLGA